MNSYPNGFGINFRINQIVIFVKNRVFLLFSAALFIYVPVCAQVPDSLPFIVKNSEKSFPARQVISMAAPALMVTYGAVSLKSGALLKLDNNVKTWLHEKQYVTHILLSDYMQFSPAVAAFGMKIAGVESTHSLRDMTVLCALSNILESVTVHTLKRTLSRMRPDGSSDNSFPSGHTASAFVAAEFLHQEYKDKSVWISIGGYTAATLTGALRILNNRHWLSDTVAGAGIGILSVKAVYLVYPSLRKICGKKDSQRPQSLIFPSINNGVFCLGFSHTF
jgi:membrane-associated phospholipid phosphatase